MKLKHNNIFLIGPMGAGKSSIGQRLAKLLNMKFVDSDREVEQRSGVDIAWIFEVEKERGFRRREHIVLTELTKERGVVLSTGGGSVIFEENRQNLSANGTVIYLTVAFDEQVARTSRRQGLRPMIEGPSLIKRLTKLNKERESLYESIADLTYATEKYKPVQLCQKILQDLSVTSA